MAASARELTRNTVFFFETRKLLSVSNTSGLQAGLATIYSILKLFAKILSNRLQAKFKQLVDLMQSRFIEGRSIIENFGMAMQMVQCAHTTKRPVMVLKLDF
jgi:hypothetical protein